MRDANHYRGLIHSNPGASIGYTLAAAAIYAARYGKCEADERGTDEWKQIARDLKARYGENLSAADVLREMEAE